jgi:hypothetical protein
MPDEIDLLRTFREHTPGPSATAWARAQTAIESARLEEGDAPQGIGAAPDQTVGRPRPGRSPGLPTRRLFWQRPGRRYVIAACVVAALVAGLLAVVLPGPRPLTKPLTTGWQPARPLPASPATPSARIGGWRLASYLVAAGWQENSAGPEPGYLTCPTTRTCYVEGDNASSSSGPADMDSFYVSSDGGATWSVLPLPGGISFTSALSCGSAVGCAAGALYNGQPVFITTANGGHSWTLDPLPAGDGQIFKLSCPSAADCEGLASATGKPIEPGIAGLMASVRVVGTTDGGAHFTAVRFESGHSLQDISCPTTSYCVAVGVYDESVLSRSAPINGFVMISRDGGASWRLGTLPAGLSPGPFPQVSCLNTTQCWMIGYVHDVAYSVMASSSDGGATWTEHSLPATIPQPQLFSFACPTAATCYAAGQDSVPQQIGSTYNAGSAVVAVTQDGGRTWSRVSFPAPAHVPGGMQGDSFLSIGFIQCPAAGSCVALGVSDQGSTSTPVYTSNP